MVKRDVLTALLDSKKAAILKAILHTEDGMYLKEISEKSGVSLGSTFRILQEFTNLEIIQRNVWKTSKVYTPCQNEKVSFLQDIFKISIDPLQTFVESVKEFQGISEIVLQKSQGNEANLLLIGEYMNSNRIQEVCEDINKQGFNLSFLTITRQQYDQMSRMGLHSGQNQVLLKK